VITGIYAAGMIEMSTFSSTDNIGSSFTNYLADVGGDIKVPYFDFFKVNFYYRNNDYKDTN
jgi:nucleoside-specific outer membrane channel protein Tsx